MSAPRLRLRSDRATYFRGQMRLAALAMGGAMGALWLLGDPNVWVGAVAGLGAVAVRGFVFAPVEMDAVWEVSEGCLTGPDGRRVALSDVVQMRRFGSFVFLRTADGATVTIRFQADAEATMEALRRAGVRSRLHA